MSVLDDLRPGDEVELTTGRGSAYGTFTGLKKHGDTRLVGMVLSNELGFVEFIEGFVRAFRKCFVLTDEVKHNG